MVHGHASPPGARRQSSVRHTRVAHTSNAGALLPALHTRTVPMSGVWHESMVVSAVTLKARRTASRGSVICVLST